MLTPHIGWQRLESRQRVVDMVADTLLICFIADEEIYGAGNPDCFAPDSLRRYIEGHPKHKKSPDAVVASDKL